MKQQTVRIIEKEQPVKKDDDLASCSSSVFIRRRIEEAALKPKSQL